jgi:sodium transport system permease protein
VGFTLREQNTASRREVGAFLLGLMLPLFFIVMVAVGCLHPAIDSIAGERERGTWETLMTTGTARANLVVAKFLTVTTLGGLAGLLNVVAMLLTMRGVMAPLTGTREPLEFAVAPAAVPVLVLGALLLAGLLAAGMLVLAAFARTFREGQSLVMPLYLAAVLPAMFLNTPDSRLTMGTAALPVVNVALVVREAIAGAIKPVETLLAALVSLCVVALLLRLALTVLMTEASVSGSHTGSVFSFLRGRRGARDAGGQSR